MILDTFRKINDSAIKFYFNKTDFNHDEFLSECLGHLKVYFEITLGDSFVYTVISFTKNQKLSFVGEAKGEVFKGHKFSKTLRDNQKEELFKLLEGYINEANESKIISLTKILLEKQTKKDVVINFKKDTYSEEILNDKIKEIHLFDNNDHDVEEAFNSCFKEKIENFQNEFPSPSSNLDLYLKYFLNYHSLSNQYYQFKEEDLLIHFIKPSIIEFDYNLLLSLATTKQLSEDQLAIVNLYMHRIVSQTATEKVQEALKHATRAAISQVMARNMSHNIGSHVMNHLIEGRQIMEIELSKQINQVNSYVSGCFNLSEEELSVSCQLANFNHYIKCRMDYLSEVTFGVPTMQTTKKIHAEVYRDFDKVRLLLNNISGINNFCYHLCFKYNGKYCCTEDVSVAFPSDLLGVQAFYNILTRSAFVK
jgi:hypothetical protein